MKISLTREEVRQALQALYEDEMEDMEVLNVRITPNGEFLAEIWIEERQEAQPEETEKSAEG